MRARSEQGARLFIRSDKLLASSVRLSQTGRRLRNGTIGKPSIGKLKKLLSQGGGETLSMNVSRGLGRRPGNPRRPSVQRSPDRLFHVAPGQFMDVDLSGCYGAIIGTLNLYAGRPVVHEPGTRRMTVKEAIALFVNMLQATTGGLLKSLATSIAFPNALIPSTRDALTNANYQLRRAKSRARRRAYGFGFDSVQNSSQARSGAVIYTRRIEAGIVRGQPPWLMIKALPSAWRREYENL